MADFSPGTEENPDDGAQALRYLLAHPDEFLAWALVRDMVAINLGRKEDLRGLKAADLDMSRFKRVDTISVTAWEQGLDTPFTVTQRYEPRRSGRFRMLGKPSLTVGDEHLTEEELEASGYIDALRTGFMNHEDAATRWESWT